MVRNIPNKYTMKMLLEEIEMEGTFNYDFLYLPIDLKSGCNMGYAFINFVHPLVALKFHEVFHERKWK